jgi:hypothetical protein
LKPREFEEIKKVIIFYSLFNHLQKDEECTFAPKTNKVSKLLDAQNTCKFV